MDARRLAWTLHNEVLEPLGLIRVLAAGAHPSAAALDGAAGLAIAALRRAIEVSWPLALDGSGLEEALQQLALQAQADGAPPTTLQCWGTVPELSALPTPAAMWCRWFGEALRCLGSLRGGALGAVQVTLDARVPPAMVLTMRHEATEPPGREGHPWADQAALSRWRAWWSAQGVALQVDSPELLVWTMRVRVSLDLPRPQDPPQAATRPPSAARRAARGHPRRSR